MNKISKKFIFIFFISLMLISILVYKYFNYNHNDFTYNYEKTLGIKLPSNSSILESKDTSDPIHGDGVVFYTIKLNPKTVSSFVKETLKNKSWNTLPLDSQLHKVLFGYSKGTHSHDGLITEIPSTIKNGIYFFHNDSTKHKSTSISLNDHSHDFIFSILDLDTLKLYILKYNS